MKYNQLEWKSFLRQQYFELLSNINNYKILANEETLMCSMDCFGYEFWNDCRAVFYRMVCIDIYNFLSSNCDGLGIIPYTKKYVTDKTTQDEIISKISNITETNYKDKFKIIRDKLIAHWENNKNLENTQDYWSEDFESIAKTIGEILVNDLGIEEKKRRYGGIESVIQRAKR